MPILLTVSVFTQVGGVDGPGWLILVPVTLWALLMGLRGILWHQIGDLAHDRRAGVRTLATRIGAERGGRFLGWMVVVEFVAAAASLAAIAEGTGQLVGSRVRSRVRRVPDVPDVGALERAVPSGRASSTTPVGSASSATCMLNEFVERWLPVAALVALALEVPIIWIARGAAPAAVRQRRVRVPAPRPAGAARRDQPPGARGEVASEHPQGRGATAIALRRGARTGRSRDS